jgi:hypothetical protein
MNVYQQAVPPDAFTPYPSRPITGLCLHHTAGTGLPAPQKGASWHRIIDRAGNIWLAVDPRHAAHCIGNTNRWRPPWVLPSPDGRTSDANYCTLNYEILYAPQAPYYQVPNEAQEAALRFQLAEDYRRFGRLPVVGHGDVDSDKWPTEPHGLRWAAIGCGERTVNGRYFTMPPEEPVITPDQQSILDSAARQTAAGNTIANGGDLDWWIGTWQQLDRDKKDLARLLATAQGERDQYMAKVGELEQQLQDATQPIATRITRVHVTATLADSSTQELEGVPM